MIWGSFFAGATAMLFAGIVLIWLIPATKNRETSQFQDQHKKDMDTLHDFWRDANRLAEERNDLLKQSIKSRG